MEKVHNWCLSVAPSSFSRRQEQQATKYIVFFDTAVLPGCRSYPAIIGTANLTRSFPWALRKLTSLQGKTAAFLMQSDGLVNSSNSTSAFEAMACKTGAESPWIFSAWPKKKHRNPMAWLGENAGIRIPAQLQTTCVWVDKEVPIKPDLCLEDLLVPNSSETRSKVFCVSVLPLESQAAFVGPKTAFCVKLLQALMIFLFYKSKKAQLWLLRRSVFKCLEQEFATSSGDCASRSQSSSCCHIFCALRQYEHEICHCWLETTEPEQKIHSYLTFASCFPFFALQDPFFYFFCH